MAERKYVEERSGKRKACKANKHDRDHSVPNENDIASEGRADIFAFNHSLKLRGQRAHRETSHFICHQPPGP